MGVTLTDVLLFGKAQSDDVDNATLVIYRRNILRWSALGGYLDIIVKGVAPLSLPDAIADSLSYVKAFGGTEQRNLPDNYIERQFIYMMDGSYLLTDIVPTYDCKIEMDFQTTSLVSAGATFLGARSGSVGDGLSIGKDSSNRIVFDGFDGNRYISTATYANNTRYKYVWNNQVATLYQGTTTIDTNTFTGTGTTTHPLAINGLNNSGSVVGNVAGIYLYSFKAWNAQGELVADYVPAVQKGTVPVVGFYDTVSGTFKTATAGTFAAGGEAVPTPDAPMDIVSNNGVLKINKNLITGSLTQGIYSNGVIDPTVLTWVAYDTAIPVENGKTYTLNAKPSVSGKTIEQNVMKYKDGVYIGYTTLANVPYTFTPDSTYNQVKLQFAYQPRENITPSNITDVQLYQNGSIYTDGTVETINAHGKNLFDKDQTPYQSGSYVVNTTVVGNNIVTASNSNYNIYKIEVGPNTAYTFGKIKATNPSWAVVDSNDMVLQTGINDGETDGRDITITTDATAKYLYLSVAVDGTYKCDDILQLELGSTATAYVPYFDGGTATAEMLLKVGDYQDVQSIIDGVVTRKVGVKVLDGTENWGDYATANGYNLAISDMTSQNYGVGLCSHFNSITSVWVEGIRFGANNSTVYVCQVKSKYSDITTFKQYLADQYAAGTPVIVIYPLATPTTESVAGQTLQVTGGDNVLEITQASLNGLELEAEYQAAVSLTIQEVQDANLDPNVEVTIN